MVKIRSVVTILSSVIKNEEIGLVKVYFLDYRTQYLYQGVKVGHLSTV